MSKSKNKSKKLRKALKVLKSECKSHKNCSECPLYVCNYQCVFIAEGVVESIKLKKDKNKGIIDTEYYKEECIL